MLRFGTRIIIYVFIFLLAGALPVFAEPSIDNANGTIEDEASITIIGESFGVTGPTIYKWDNFEGETHIVGQDLGAGPAGQQAWSIVNQNQPTTSYIDPAISNDTPRAGSKFVRCDIDNKAVPVKTTSMFSYYKGSDFGSVYMSAYIRYHKLSTYPVPVGQHEISADYTCNEKFFRLAGNSFSIGSDPYVRFISNQYPSYKLFIYDNNVTLHSEVNILRPADNDWVRIELFGVDSTVDTSDGTVIFTYQATENGAFFTPFSNTEQKTRVTSKGWDRFYFGEYVDGLSTTPTRPAHFMRDYDDIYIASSRAILPMSKPASTIS